MCPCVSRALKWPPSLQRQRRRRPAAAGTSGCTRAPNGSAEEQRISLRGHSFDRIRTLADISAMTRLRQYRLHALKRVAPGAAVVRRQCVRRSWHWIDSLPAGFGFRRRTHRCKQEADLLTRNSKAAPKVRWSNAATSSTKSIADRPQLHWTNGSRDSISFHREVGCSARGLLRHHRLHRFHRSILCLKVLFELGTESCHVSPGSRKQHQKSAAPSTLPLAPQHHPRTAATRPPT